MLRALLGRRLVAIGAVLFLLIAGASAMAAFGGGDDAVVVYNGRSQYGDARPFDDFEHSRNVELQLRGGTAPELFERLRSEGDDTPADVLITTDLANLWRAKEAGLLSPASSSELQSQVPEQFRDPQNQWWGLSLRIRTPMRSTERVPAGSVKSYEDLGKRRFKGRLCLRTSNNEYNQSLVADMLAKRGPQKTEALLRSWMDNEPKVLGSDVDVLDAIAAGRCDVGLTNHYYLGRMLAEKPKFPVAPAWPDQDGKGAHTNLSGIGVVKASKHRQDAIALMEHLTSPHAQRQVVENSELAVNEKVLPPAHIREWAKVRKDPIDVARAGKLLPDAVALMQRVGWR